MSREIVHPTVGESGEEQHPAWVLVGASRVSHGPKGAVLFDSDVRHQHYVVVSVKRAARKRDLHHDWKYGREQIIKIALSEAQWASFVSSMNSGDGTPATLLWDGTIEDFADREVPGMPYAPRLQESMDEVHEAAERTYEKVKEAFEVVKERPTKANIRALEIALQNATPNVDFAASSLSEHAENVVQRARADIEAFVTSKAQQLGLDPGDLGAPPQLTAGD